MNHAIFHIGENNIRSQKAIEKPGAIKLKPEELESYSQAHVNSVVYRISKEDWKKRATSYGASTGIDRPS